MCRPGHAPSRHPPTGGHTGPPLQREGEVPATTQASGAQRSVCAADGRKGLESRQRSSPKCPATSDNPSVTAAPCQLPLHKGALGDGGCGLPRRPVGPPRNDNGFLSFRGAERRGNPYFYDGRGFGPPYLGHGLRRPNFVPKFGASVRSSCPTGDGSSVRLIFGSQISQRGAFRRVSGVGPFFPCREVPAFPLPSGRDGGVAASRAAAAL